MKARMKVYVVEVGAYSDRYVDAVFTTRELADGWIEDQQRRRFAIDGRKAERRIASWRAGKPPVGRIELAYREDGVATMTATVDGRALPVTNVTYEDIPAETFDQFVKRNYFGDITEYEVWDALPVADLT